MINQHENLVFYLIKKNSNIDIQKSDQMVRQIELKNTAFGILIKKGAA
jgi:hypothetical protein